MGMKPSTRPVSIEQVRSLLNKFARDMKMRPRQDSLPSVCSPPPAVNPVCGIIWRMATSESLSIWASL
jgi:hypothetical protein